MEDRYNEKSNSAEADGWGSLFYWNDMPLLVRKRKGGKSKGNSNSGIDVAASSHVAGSFVSFSLRIV